MHQGDSPPWPLITSCTSSLLPRLRKAKHLGSFHSNGQPTIPPSKKPSLLPLKHPLPSLSALDPPQLPLHPPVSHFVLMTEVHRTDYLYEEVPCLLLLHDKAIPRFKGAKLQQNGLKDVISHVATSHVLHYKPKVRPAAGRAPVLRSLALASQEGDTASATCRDLYDHVEHVSVQHFVVHHQPTAPDIPPAEKQQLNPTRCSGCLSATPSNVMCSQGSWLMSCLADKRYVPSLFFVKQGHRAAFQLLQLVTLPIY